MTFSFANDQYVYLGLGAGAMGFTLRSGFNFFVLLFRIWRMPK